MSRNIKIFFTQNFTFVGFLLIIYIVISLIYWYSSVVEKEVINASRNEIHETVVQVERSIESPLKEKIQDLQILAEYIARENIDKNNAAQYLESQSQTDKFIKLFYISTDGYGVSRNNEKEDFSLDNVFLEALEAPYTLSKPYSNISKSKFYFEIAVPIIKNDAVTGVLLAETLMDINKDDIEKITKDTGLFFLLDKDLDIIYTNSHQYHQQGTITESEFKLIGTSNSDEAMANIDKNIDGSFIFDLDGVKKFVVYQPIALPKWILALSIEANSTNAALQTAVGHISSVAAIILLILLSLIVYIWFTKSTLLHSLEKTAYYDSLTGLPNLLKLKKDIKEVLKDNIDQEYGVLKFDIQNFKVINELFGFDVGNSVLSATKNAYSKLKEPSLMFGRIGSDEFLVFAKSNFLENIEDRLPFYEKHYKKLLPEIKNHKLSFNYGVYKIELGETDVDSIVNNVTLAHKMSKEDKIKRVHYYDKVIKMQLLLEAEINDKMEAALLNKEFKVFLQPKFNLTDNTILGAEALVRWIGKSGIIVYPDVFIPLFEKNGFIKEIDKYVLETVCKTLQSWIEKGFTINPISVNYSRINLNTPNLVSEITAIVDKYNIPHKYIDIELTESAMLGNEENFEKLFSGLHERGFKISIDDFGAGYSSLGLIKNLKADTLKLDKSFMGDSTDIERSNKVIGGVIRLAHSLNMCTLAEGVETIEQVTILKAMHCNAVQGYYFAKPMPISEYEENFL